MNKFLINHNNNQGFNNRYVIKSGKKITGVLFKTFAEKIKKSYKLPFSSLFCTFN